MSWVKAVDGSWVRNAQKGKTLILVVIVMIRESIWLLLLYDKYLVRLSSWVKQRSSHLCVEIASAYESFIQFHITVKICGVLNYSVGFWMPKTCFSHSSGKNQGKAVFARFWTVFTAKNWQKPDLLYDVAFRWWIFNTYKKTTHYIH